MAGTAWPDGLRGVHRESRVAPSRNLGGEWLGLRDGRWRFHVEVGHEQEIEDVERVIVPVDGDRSAHRPVREKLTMRDAEPPTVGQMDRERLERRRLMNLAQSFESHVSSHVETSARPWNRHAN